MGRVKVIRASAGSGKTFRLAYEYIRRVVCEPMQYRHILAVTFTNKATEEMKRRILSELDALAQGRMTVYMGMLADETGFSPADISRRALRARTRILHDYNRFAVVTIDKFFQRIIRSFVRELGIDINFNLELQTDNLLSRSADALIEQMAEDQELRSWISGYVEERIDENRKWDIKSSLTAIGKELFRENFKRVAAEVPDKTMLQQIIKSAAKRYHAVTGRIKNTAAEAMQIIDGAGLCVADFSFGKTGVAGYLQKTAEGRIEDYGVRVTKALVADEGWYSKTSGRKDEITAIIAPLRERLEAVCDDYRTNCRFFASYLLLKDNYRNFALLGDLARMMEEICAEDSIMPISETNEILRKLISGNDTPFIFEKAGNHFDTFMIDEFQDTSTMQWENFLPLLENALSQKEDREDPVLIVGDVKQSIYRWRGGDWRILAREVDGRFPDNRGENLTHNWRSLPEVVRFNNRLLEKITVAAGTALEEKLETAHSEGYLGDERTTELKSMVQSAYKDHTQLATSQKQGGHVTVTFYGLLDKDPVPPVIRQIEQLQERGYSPGEIAVLVRYNADGVKIADMLLDRKSRNPDSGYCYDVVTQEALTIGSSPAVNFVMACFRLSGGENKIPQKVFYNSFLDRDFAAAMPEDEQQFVRSLRSRPVGKAFDDVVSYYGIFDPSHAAYLQALQDQLLYWTNSRLGDMPMFVKWWDESGAGQSVNVPGNGNAVNILSIHKSKGLEYKAVIIPYCNWSLTPTSRSLIWSPGSGGEFETLGTVPLPYGEKIGASHFSEGYFTETVMSYIDNINLLYVAATRAEEELHIMVPGIPKTPGSISSLIYGAMPFTGDTVEMDGIKGRVLTGENEITVRFGEPVHTNQTGSNPPAPETVTIPFIPYDIEGKVKQKRNYLRFKEEGIKTTVSPRDIGIMLHRVFENARTADDIFAAVDSLIMDGDISGEETSQLTNALRKALANPQVGSWFSPRWNTVLNERDILIPGSGIQRRPDRVMVCGDETVVVDYKFGSIRDNGHARQVSRYVELLRQMHGGTVKGYVWYVTLDEIVEV